MIFLDRIGTVAPQVVTMRHVLQVVSVALPLVCGVSSAMAFTSGVPPLSGPGSVFYGHPEKGGDPAVPPRKFQRKQWKSQPGSGARGAPKKQSE
jgi:hypothetical protein